MTSAASDRGRLFPSTRWTLIRRAQGDQQARRRALDELLCLYVQPLLRLALLRGLPREHAADAVQDFALHLLENEAIIERLDPARGRLRSFLRAAFHHHMDNRHAYDHAQKRGGGYRVLSLDASALELTSDAGADPGATYERQWAHAVLDRALAALAREFGSGARSGPFEVLESYFRSGEPPSYQEVAERYAMSLPQVKAFLHRARARYRQLVESELRDTVDDASEVSDELACLLEALRA